MSAIKKYTCDPCQFQTIYHCSYKTHLKTNKHNLVIQNNLEIPVAVFKCEPCNYETSSAATFGRHIRTPKHHHTVYDKHLRCTACYHWFQCAADIATHACGGVPDTLMEDYFSVHHFLTSVQKDSDNDNWKCKFGEYIRSLVEKHGEEPVRGCIKDILHI